MSGCEAALVFCEGNEREAISFSAEGLKVKIEFKAERRRRKKMKKKLVKMLLFSLSLFFLVGCGGTSNYMVKADKPVEISKEKANVYFMRPSGIGFAINFQIWDGDKFVGLSQAKSYFRYVCDPGKHLFIAVAENKTYVPAELEAGKRYYVITEPRIGWIKARITLTPVKKGSEEMGNVKNWEGDLEYTDFTGPGELNSGDTLLNL